jgi:hypothetical protein
MPESEVARLKEQIERECQAMQLGFSGYAAVGRHEIIANRYKALGKYMEQLDALVGEEEATNIVAETYIKVLG